MELSTRRVAWACGLGVLLLLSLIAAARFVGSVPDGTVAANLNALAVVVSAFAFGGFLFAVYLQREELLLQREELTATRTELEGQRLAMEAQVRLARVQSFDSTFFAMVALTNSVSGKSQITPFGPNNRFEGSQAFDHAASSFEGILADLMRTQAPLSSLMNRVNMSMSEVCYHPASDLSHYFRSLEALVSFTWNAQPTNEELYWTVVRSLFSMSQQRLVYYYALSERSSPTFKQIASDARLFWGLATTPQINAFSSVIPSDLAPPVHRTRHLSL